MVLRFCAEIDFTECAALNKVIYMVSNQLSLTPKSFDSSTDSWPMIFVLNCTHLISMVIVCSVHLQPMHR